MRPYMLYDFQVNGVPAGLEAFLKNYHHYLHCDAHSVYDQIFISLDAVRPAPIEVGCGALARRKFYDARTMNAEAFEVLNLIGDLYKLERKLNKASTGERHSMRQLHAVSVLNDIFTFLKEIPSPSSGVLIKVSVHLGIQQILSKSIKVRQP